MIHIMKLQERYFNFIKNGTKKYENRLNDEKRKLIKKGDFIEFQKEPLLEEKIILEVDELLYYDNFKELFDELKIEYLADKSVSKEKLKSDLEKFYTIEKQKEYGVVALKLKKENIINYGNIKELKDNEIFNFLRKTYDNFDIWLNKIHDVFYTINNNKITSILILKMNEKDSQQFFEKGNILKIRTLFVLDKNKGIGTNYLKIIDEIATKNNLNYIYLTIKKYNKELINFIEKNNYKKHNDYNDEFVYYKEL